MDKKQIDKMQKLCYDLAHSIRTLTKEDVNYIQYHLHKYVETQKNWISNVHLPEDKKQ